MMVSPSWKLFVNILFERVMHYYNIPMSEIKEIKNVPPSAKPKISDIRGCLVDGFWDSSSPDLG
jgi:hypothetical protein